MGESVRSAKVLVVCTANAIRSPFVAHLPQRQLAEEGVEGFRIESAGTAARPGLPAEPEVIERARAYGLDVAGHRTRRLDESVLHSATTVLCAARAHRRLVLDMRPDLLDSTFTVREFARLAGAAEPTIRAAGDWPSLVHAAARTRTRLRGDRDGEDDIVDPIGQGAAVWDEFERQARDAVARIIARAAALPAVVAAPAVASTLPRTRREWRSGMVDPGSRAS